MPTPWHSSINGRKPKVLTVFPTTAVTNGIWGPAFRKAIQEFNNFKLNVTLVESSVPPDENVLAGADIKFDAVAGAQKFTFMGTEFTTAGKPPSPIFIGGNSIAGLTIKRGQGAVERAYVYVPIHPMSLAPLRPVGESVMVFIAVHEFLHAVGLQDSDHSPENDADTFMGPPVTTPSLESDNTNPNNDKVTNGKPLAQKKSFPPNKLTGRVRQLVNDMWL